MIRSPVKRPVRDPSIALINVVFLMLIFFLIAGTVAAPLDADLELVNTDGLDGKEPPDALVLHADGRLTYRGSDIDAEAYMALNGAQPVRIVPDRAVSGPRLIEVSARLRRLGATSVILVTERAL